MNLLDQIKQNLTPDIIKSIASYIGADENATAKGLAVVVPSMISGMAAAGKNEGLAGRLFDTITGLFSSDNEVTNFTSNTDFSSIATKGEGLVNDLFGKDVVPSFSEAIAKESGLSAGASAKLMNVMAPYIAGTMAKNASSDANQFADNLRTQAEHAAESIPTAIADLGTAITTNVSNFFGGVGKAVGDVADDAGKVVGDVADGAGKVVSGVVEGTEKAIGNVVDGAEDLLDDVSDSLNKGTKKVSETLDKTVGGGGNMFKRILPLLLTLLLILVLWLFFNKGCKKDAGAVATTDTTSVSENIGNQLDSAAMNAKALWETSLGAMIVKQLSNGKEISIPENGVEAQIIKYLDGGCQGDMKETWFNFDRVLFNTGSAVLNTVSNEQIDNLTQIMLAYPNAKFKLGGYTDNTGNAESNKKLSGERATAILNKLVESGVAADRLSAEGYGSEHPVCPENDTDECRAKNRRVSMRVTQCN